MRAYWYRDSIKESVRRETSHDYRAIMNEDGETVLFAMLWLKDGKAHASIEGMDKNLTRALHGWGSGKTRAIALGDAIKPHGRIMRRADINATLLEVARDYLGWQGCYARSGWEALWTRRARLDGLSSRKIVNTQGR
jgi:hypothetical protein